MNLERLERQRQRLSNTLSKFAAALKAAQTKFEQDLSESDGQDLSDLDIRYMQLIREIKEIKRNLSEVRRSVCGIGEKIMLLKSFEDIL